MFDIGWTELLLIGIVALIVIGPQDLPDMFRQLGRFTAKLRSMSRDFQRAMEQAAKESGVKDLAKDVNSLASPKSLGLNAVKEAADRFEKWDPLKPVTAAAAQPLKPAPMPPTPTSAAAQAAAANPSLSPVGSLGAAPTPEELADVEPELPRKHGPATQALYDKKAKVAADRAAKAQAVVAAPDASPAASPARRKATGRKTGGDPAVAPATPVPQAGGATKTAARRRQPAALPDQTGPAVAAAAPKTPRRRKADPA
jgi:sec-independent protein translocase protein TatB